MSEKAFKPLLPDFIKKPILMLWAFIVPQMILLLINGYSYWLICKEVDAGGKTVAGSILGAELGLIAVSFFVWLYARARREYISLPWNGIFLVTHISFLWYACSSFGKIIPTNTEPWILDSGMLIFSQFALIMPGLFYSGLRLACFDLKIKKVSDFVMSLIMTIAGPLTYYVFFLVLTPLMYRVTMHFPVVLSIILFIVTTVMGVVGMIRLMVMAYNLISQKGELAQIIFAVIFGVAGPVGGLLLNRLIPFPANFQSPWVYVLAIVNGLIVAIPSLKKADGHGYLLFARSVTYLFTFYFFLVFLPFLPLSLPAMFAIGSGFLILVPFVLFLLHTKRLYDDFQICRQAHGAWLSIFLVVLGFMILPGYFVRQAVMDKIALKSALNYVYSPDLTKESVYKGNVNHVKRTLMNLKQFKQGIQLPYLSGLYNQVVFEGMVLPDSKIDYLYELFAGEELKLSEEKSALGFYGLMRGTTTWRGATRPVRDQNVELSSLSVAKAQSDGITKARVNLTMTNLSNSDTAEFMRTIDLPESVLITDFSLKVENEMVKGRIFEKRAAMWVYHMIRDFTQRDPGILSYKTPTRVDLNVYPFLRRQVREAEIEFSYPQGISPEISIGDKSVLGEKTLEEKDSPIYVIPSGSQKSFVIIPQKRMEAMPQAESVAYLHFILDRSQGAYADQAQILRQMKEVIDQYQGKTCGLVKITAANFNVQDISLDFVSLNMPQLLDRVRLPLQGSLNLERVIKSILIRPRQQIEVDGVLTEPYPVFVVITSAESKMLVLKDMDFYQDLDPYTNEIIVSRGIGQIEALPLWTSPQEHLANQVVRIEENGSSSFIPARPDSPFVLNNASGATPKQLNVFNPQSRQVQAFGPVQVLDPSSEYAKGLRLKFENQAILHNPVLFEEELGSLVKASRDADVMSQSTSFIIVERSAQWKALQVKEHQRLNTSEGLEFEEDFNTPSPSVYILLFLFFLFKQISLQNKKNTL